MEEHKEQEEGIISKVWNIVTFIPRYFWSTLVWFKDIFFGRDDETAALNGTEFNVAY